MATDTNGYGWLSSQVYFDGDLYGAATDRVLLEVVEPVGTLCLDRQWARRCFFIRYGHMGPHIRFRFYGPRQALESRIKPHLIEVADASGLIERMEWQAYEPETYRYGGPCGVALAERFFHSSSQAAHALLRKTDAKRRSTRLGKGLLAMLVLLHTFRDSRTAASELSAAYGSYYLHAMAPDEQQRAARIEIFKDGYDRQAEQLAPYVETAWGALEDMEPLTAELDLYRHHLTDIHRRFLRLAEADLLRGEETTFDGLDHCIQQIVPSYIHMMNNRLGITTQEETYLALVIHRTLDRMSKAMAANI